MNIASGLILFHFFHQTFFSIRCSHQVLRSGSSVNFSKHVSFHRLCYPQLSSPMKQYPFSSLGLQLWLLLAISMVWFENVRLLLKILLFYIITIVFEIHDFFHFFLHKVMDYFPYSVCILSLRTNTFFLVTHFFGDFSRMLLSTENVSAALFRQENLLQSLDHDIPQKKSFL